jgi:DNA polymerase III alpha subunit
MRTGPQPGLFKPEVRVPKGIRPVSEDAMIGQELEVLDCLVSCHPLDLYRDELAGRRLTLAQDLRKKLDRRVTLAGRCVTGKLAQTSAGEIMEFVSFEDRTGIYETVFFPDVYKRHCHMIRRGGAYLVSGRVALDLGAVCVEADSLRRLAGKHYKLRAS